MQSKPQTTILQFWKSNHIRQYYNHLQTKPQATIFRLFASQGITPLDSCIIQLLWKDRIMFGLENESYEICRKCIRSCFRRILRKPLSASYELICVIALQMYLLKYHFIASVISTNHSFTIYIVSYFKVWKYHNCTKIKRDWKN